jgi:hypothetical protein
VPDVGVGHDAVEGEEGRRVEHVPTERAGAGNSSEILPGISRPPVVFGLATS